MVRRKSLTKPIPRKLTSFNECPVFTSTALLNYSSHPYAPLVPCSSGPLLLCSDAPLLFCCAAPLFPCSSASRSTALWMVYRLCVFMFVMERCACTRSLPGECIAALAPAAALRSRQAKASYSVARLKLWLKLGFALSRKLAPIS